MKIRILIFLYLLILFVAGACNKSEPAQVPFYDEKMEDTLYQIVNQYRMSIGKDSLIIDKIVQREAREHSYSMARRLVEMGHTNFEIREQRIKNILGDTVIVAETVTYAWDSPEVAFQFWLSRQTDSLVLVGNYNLTGVGIVKSTENIYYFTQIFVYQ